MHAISPGVFTRDYPVTALPASGSFTQVDPTHVAAIGPAAAILYARIEWRSKHGGEWRATKQTLMSETGLRSGVLRGAIEALRAAEWITTRRTSPEDATLIWAPVRPAQSENVIPAPPMQDQHHPLAESTISSTETSKTLSTSRPLRVVTDDEKPERPEVVALCNRLADRIEGNGSKRPRITKAWLDECRRLLDLDGRTPEQVARAIDWCQADTFWRANILSMPTLRKQYDRLRLAAQRDQAPAADPAAIPPPRTTPWGDPSEPVPPYRPGLYG